MKDRIRLSNPGDTIATTIIDNMASKNNTPLPVFYFGQVVSVTDKKNANRIKVRVPLLDNTLYYNDKGQLEEEKGDDKLPWCIPALGRFIETPEVNSVVLVALLNVSSPFNGRIWFTPVKDLTSKKIFEDLKAEIEGEDAWKLVEDSTEIFHKEYPNKSGNKIKNKKSSVNFLVGIKGKSNNRLTFDENDTTLIQGEGKSDEAKLILSKLIELKGKNLNILSTSSTTEHRPVFADPLFEYLTDTQNILTQISTLLSTTPGSLILPVPGSPIGPSPAAAAIVSATTSATASLEKLKIPGNGKSKYIKIN
jgi:hypothetical protein